MLHKLDYIIVNDSKYNFTDNYGELSNDGFGALLDTLLEPLKIAASIDNLGRLILSSDNQFTINDMSYNAKMISGFYNDPFPIVAEQRTDEKYYVAARSIGHPLSTPILYLISNLGAKCYENVDDTYSNCTILMRVSNSFTSGYPIINGNAEFTSIVPVNSLSNIEFRLVDANKHDIMLLSPMYLSIQADSVETEDETKIDLMQAQQQLMQQQVQAQAEQQQPNDQQA